MNTPLSGQNKGVLHTSRRRVQAQVVTLERVQQSCPASFNVSHVVKQQHPRFHSHDSTLVPLEHIQVEVEGMRGVLESCWDLSAPATATTHAPVLQQHQHSFSIRHAQLQRLRRSRGDHTITHAAPGTVPAQQQQPQQCGRARRSRSSAQSAAAGSLAATAAAGSTTSVDSLVQSSSNVLPDQHTHQLQVLMNLWHLHTTHLEDWNSAQKPERYHIPLPKAPRLLTADEERVLGSIIQQHRKLQQLWKEHPDIAAAAFSTSSSSSSSTHTTGLSSSNSSSSSGERMVGPDRRYRWPPPLSQADIAEVTQLPSAWRSLLPMLAAHASDLLVAFNTGLVMFMLGRANSNTYGVPVSDLVTSGISGLRLAAQRYNPAKGTRFSTVATVWISQHIARSSLTEAGRALRRPEHHTLMVNYVLVQYGVETLQDIENRPEVVAEVAQKYKAKPNSVLETLVALREQHSTVSLEAAAPVGKGKADSEGAVWAAMLTTADLDEGDGQLGPSGDGPTISGGAGTLQAAAGQVPVWAQAGVRGLQQQQQQQQVYMDRASPFLPAAGGGGSSSSGTYEQVAAAAQKLLQLLPSELTSAASTVSPVSSVTGTMLDSVDDSEGVLQQNMQQMLHVLTPLERRVISTLYGLDVEHKEGLGVELPPSSWLGSISSNSSSSSSGSGKERRGRKAKGAAADSSSSSSSSSSSRSSSPNSSYDGQQTAQGKTPRNLPAARFARGAMTLQEATAVLQLPSHQLTANIRNVALGKLAAAAAAAAWAAVGAAQGAEGARQGAVPVGISSSSSSSDGEGNPAAPAAASLLEASAPISKTASTYEMIALLQSYVAEYGHLPQDMCERYQGKLLARWCARIRTRYWQGKLAPLVASTLQEMVPTWDWGHEGLVREQNIARKVARQQRKAAAAAAAAAAEQGPGGAAAVGALDVKQTGRKPGAAAAAAAAAGVEKAGRKPGSSKGGSAGSKVKSGMPSAASRSSAGSKSNGSKASAAGRHADSSRASSSNSSSTRGAGVARSRPTAPARQAAVAAAGAAIATSSSSSSVADPVASPSATIASSRSSGSNSHNSRLALFSRFAVAGAARRSRASSSTGSSSSTALRATAVAVPHSLAADAAEAAVPESASVNRRRRRST